MRPLSDTIVAPATPAGVAALGIVRMSGPEALLVADVMFRCAGRPLSRRRPWSAVYGHVHEPGSDEAVDEVVAVVFRGPRSYTGQDMVEFTCHGNPLILAQVVQAARQAGARDAAPGEFTYRAYMSGRLDLMQCEAVADLIGSHSREAIRAARQQQRGVLSHRISDLRSALIEAQAGLEYAVDFPDDDPDNGISAATEAIRHVRDELAMLRATAVRSVSLRDCATVAIVGRPNVGKSSLLNALAGRRRSIVTARPGTTRDVVEQTVDLGGATIMLQDTAGVRMPRDDAERAGVDLATEAASCADLILLVLDARRGWTQHDQRIAAALDASRTVWVWNKTDLVDGDREARLLKRSRGLGATGDVVALSATGGAGVSELADLIGHRAVSHASRQSPALTNARHVDLLDKAARLLENALNDGTLDDQPEIAAIPLQEATAALEELVGRTTSDDIVARVFARFCVGK